MSKKLTTEDFILKARQVHGWRYDYSKVNYTKSNEKICIICSIHGEFWQTPNAHLSGKGCDLCGGSFKYSKQSYIEKANQVHNNKYSYSKVEYKSIKDKIEIICTKHGSFWQEAGSHLQGHGCPICTQRSYKYTFDEIIEKFNVVHYGKYFYPKQDYVNRNSKMKIICPTHGEFYQSVFTHLNGGGCPKCKNKKLSNIHRSNKQEFINKAIEIHGDKYSYEYVNYINGRTPIKIICCKHGEFWQKPEYHLSGRGCPKCSASHGELKIEEYLKNNVIEYKTQYPVKLEQRMFARNNLKIDFYLPKYNTFIEFNGIQHYKFKRMFHKSKEGFNKQVERDKRLKEYCKENKIKLIVIKYNQINKIEEILNKKLKIN